MKQFQEKTHEKSKPHDRRYYEQLGQSPENYSSLLRLKKKQIIQSQDSLKSSLKKAFSDLTISLMNYETNMLDNLSNNYLLRAYEKIDELCSMSESEQSYNQQQIENMLHLNFQIVTKDPAQFVDDIINIKNNLEEGNSIEKTNKKGLSKEKYEHIITKLQEKIEKLIIKEEKYQRKFKEIKEKRKIEEPSNFPSFKIQRLEAENKVLIEQISSCSEKIIELMSQNSILKDTTHLPTTQKKQPRQNESFLLDEYKMKISELVQEVSTLKQNLSEEEKKNLEKNQQVTLLVGEIRHKQIQIEEIKDYNVRLYGDYEINVKRKVQCEEKINLLEKQKEQSSSKIQKLEEQFENCKKVIKLKEERQVEQLKELETLTENLRVQESKEIDNNFKNLQTISDLEKTVKSKKKQNDELKQRLKVSSRQIQTLKGELFQKQKENKELIEQNKLCKSEIVKINKEKDSLIKKEVNKTKKELKKQFQNEKKQMNDNFNLKMGSFLERVTYTKKQLFEIKEKLERRLKISQNRYELLKSRLEYQFKEMIDKIKIKANCDIIEKYIESQSSLALKNSQIQKLKEEISKKSKNEKQHVVQSVEANQAQNELHNFEKKVLIEKACMEKKAMEDEIRLIRQKCEVEIEKKENQVKDLKENIERLAKENKENEFKNKIVDFSQQEAKFKNKIKKLEEKNNQQQFTLGGIKQNMAKIQSQNQQLQSEIKVKKQLIIGIKRELKEKEQQRNKLNGVCDGLAEEIQKLKRGQREATKKENMFYEIKDKVKNYEEMEIQMQHLRKQLEEKQKIHRIELNKKQTQIKESKINEENILKKLKKVQNLQDDIKELKTKNKKLKDQVDRKEKLIEHLKTKNERAVEQGEENCQKYEEQRQKNQKSIYILEKKLDATKNELQRMQSKCTLLKISIKKVYDKVCEKMSDSVQQNMETAKITPYNFQTDCSPSANTKKYEEGLSILQLTYEDLDIKFEDTYSPSPMQYQSPVKIEPGAIEEKLCNDDVEPKQIVEQFTKLLFQK